MDLTALSATELKEGLGRGDFSSEEVVRALLERHQTVNPGINAVIAQCEDALDRAREADRARSSGESLGPLHGLPITIKDNVDVEGMDSTLGLRSRVGLPAAKDAVLVDELRRCGALVLGKTNVPQVLLAQETENVVFGVTRNPWNHERVPGGSSGGEAAAVAAGISPFGIGTDIGGSIRVPAHFCGIAGFKPTLDRWSNRGSRTAIKGQEMVRAQIGCLARTAADAALLYRSISPQRMNRADPLVAPLPTGDPSTADLSGMTIGYFDDDGFLPPVASVKRALARAVEVLGAAGATMVPHRPASSREVLCLWLSALSSDGGQTLDQAIGSDPVSPQIRPSRLLMRVPGPARKAASRLLAVVGEDRLAMLLEILGEKSVADLWQLTNGRTELRLKEFDSWNRMGLDAVVCPPHVVPAMGHRESGDYALSLAAEFRWTLLNFPAGVVPVTRALVSEIGGYGSTSDRVGKKTAQIDQESAGLPVGVQVVARPFAEETLLAVMMAVESAVRDDDGFPTTPILSS